MRLRSVTRAIVGDDRPKQYVPLISADSLLRQTVARAARLSPKDRTLVVSQQRHAGWLAADLGAHREPKLLLQPENRDTAAGVLLPVYWIAARDPDATVVVYPSDHFVLEEAAFVAHVAEVVAFVDRQDSEDAEHTYEALVRAFEWFGGSPAEVLVDNQKCAVIAHRRAGDVQFHPRFVDLAGHYGFRPRACRPARAQTKGKDERNVGYIKHHFFVRYRAFESWAHLNQLAEQWLREEADPRVHGTVHEVVAERFAREAPTLQPLPPRRYDTAYWEPRQVGWDAYVEIRGNRYSVPASLAGRPVQVRITLDGAVAVYDGAQCVAQHQLQAPAQGWVTVPDHHAALWADTLAVERRSLTVYEEVVTWN
jgi:Integrase core domain/Nucleotidyl transferase